MALFGALNTTMAKTIAENSPKYDKIIEPFGDGGTFALYLKKKKPKTHILNIVDEILFNAFVFIQNITGSEKSQLKKFDWIGTKETFDSVVKINATSGAQFFYNFLYIRHFGTRVEEGETPLFDVSKINEDISNKLFDIPLMRVALKGITIENDDPAKHINSGGQTFLILLPKTPEDNELVRSKLNGISGNFFYSNKVKDFNIIIEDAESFNNLIVSPLSVASFMVGDFSVLKNYESKIEPIDLELIEQNI